MGKSMHFFAKRGFFAMCKKHVLISIFFLSITNAIFAQDALVASITGQLVKTTESLVLAKMDDSLSGKLATVRDIKGLVGFNKKAQIPDNQYDVKTDADGAIDTHNGLANRLNSVAATMGVSINGQSNAAISPGDPSIAAGPNHVVQIVNASGGSSIRIFDKAGNIIISTILMSAVSGIQGAGDPVVLYDQLANRWLLTEFGRSNGVTAYINTLVICVSATPDPTGAWKTYSFADDNFFLDFPKLAVWNNAYYATSNDFTTSGSAYLGSSIYALDRTAMLSGAASATAIRLRLNKEGGEYASMSPVTLEGNTLPAPGTNGLFTYFQDDAFTADTNDADSLMIFQFSPNFTTPSASVVSPETKMLCAPLDRALCNAARGACISQMSTTLLLEGLTKKLGNKVVYRNFGTHESIVCNTTVDAGDGRAGIRWWEVRRNDGNNGTWGIYQEATEAGAVGSTENRWLGTINMDILGNIALAYNVSGPSTYPSLRFVARSACDPLNTMTMAETTIAAGTSAQTVSARYGDYNAMAIDPSTQRDFWLTAQYNTTTNWNTRIASFKLNSCSNLPKIRFDSATILTTEASTTNGTLCQKYKDVSFKISIDAPPLKPATINFGLVNGGTATNNVDYILQTTSVILDSANLSKTVTLRIIDDPEVELTEEIAVNYNIISAGNAVADTYNQTCRIFISDNEILPLVDYAATNKQVFNFTIGLSVGGPFQNYLYTDKRVQYLYTAAALKNAGITAGTITAIGLTVSAKNSTAPYNEFKMAMGTTTQTTLSGGFLPGLTNKFSQASYSTILGLNTFNLNSAFSWDGVSNVVIEFCYNNTANNGTADDLIQGFGAGTIQTALGRTNLVATDAGCNLSHTNTAINIPVLFITGSFPGTFVERQAGEYSAAEVKNNGNNVLYSAADNELIASLSSMPAGVDCITTKIDASGTTWQPFFNGLRSQKVVEVLPASFSNPTYKITLYYTNEELAALAPATLNMLKTNATSASGATAANSVVVVPTVTDYGSYKSFTGTFTGFSKFFLVQNNLLLPVTWLSFTAVKDKNDALLQWATATELNSSRFEIQTSTNGTDFITLGTVSSKGNSNSRQDYSFTHARPPGGTHYYRIKQIDKDGNSTYSELASLNFEGRLHIKPFVYPSPAAGYIIINFGSVHKGVQWQLFTADGRMIKKGVANELQMQQQIDIQALPPGSYLVKVAINGSDEILRFVKQ